VPKKFCLLDVAAWSHEPHATGFAVTRIARVMAFNNLSDDSSPDVHKTPSPGKMIEKCVCPPPLVSGEFLRFSFMIFTAGPDNIFCRSYPACTLTRFATGESRRRPGVLPLSCKFCFTSAFLHCGACSDRLFYFVGSSTVRKAA
jgi:hypothetical protein